MSKKLSDRERTWLPGVGRRLRLLRELHGLTQEAMATQIGFGKQAWTKYESGSQLPNVFLMLEVCARFRVSIDYVYRGTLFGVHPDLAAELAARDPELVANTNRILRGMGTSQFSGMAPILDAVPTNSP